MIKLVGEHLVIPDRTILQDYVRKGPFFIARKILAGKRSKDPAVAIVQERVFFIATAIYLMISCVFLLARWFLLSRSRGSGPASQVIA